MLICPLNTNRILATTLQLRFGIVLRVIESSCTGFTYILANALQLLHTTGKEFILKRNSRTYECK